MNEIIRELKERKSVRVFEERTIPEELKKLIIESAFEAPTAGGMMLYSIIDVTDAKLKKQLAISCDNQPFIMKAPLILIFLADYQRWYDAFCQEGCEPRKPGEGDLLLACADAIIAAQNTVVAAQSLGIGSCYIGDVIENCEIVREMLNLPDYVVPAAMVVYGYPSQGQLTRKKPLRFDQNYIVYENQYHRLTKEEQEQMHRERNKKAGISDADVSEGIIAICNRKYMSEFSMEM
ncbi:MAG: nitroreductase, partial [Herbinix sp.]|nr:nitroreductase [Herbinix sp.]